MPVACCIYMLHLVCMVRQRISLDWDVLQLTYYLLNQEEGHAEAGNARCRTFPSSCLKTNQSERKSLQPIRFGLWSRTRSRSCMWSVLECGHARGVALSLQLCVTVCKHLHTSWM